MNYTEAIIQALDSAIRISEILDMLRNIPDDKLRDVLTEVSAASPKNPPFIPPDGPWHEATTSESTESEDDEMWAGLDARANPCAGAASVEVLIPGVTSEETHELTIGALSVIEATGVRGVKITFENGGRGGEGSIEILEPLASMVTQHLLIEASGSPISSNRRAVRLDAVWHEGKDTLAPKIGADPRACLWCFLDVEHEDN